MQKSKYTKKQLEEARKLFGTETPERLDEAMHNLREFFSILREWDEEDRDSRPRDVGPSRPGPVQLEGEQRGT